MLFTYKALIDNKITRGEMEAGSVSEVTEYLKNNGFFPVEINEKKKSEYSLISQIVDRVSFSDITYMTRQFAIMLDAGLTLIDALEILVKQTQKAPFKKMLQDIDRTIRDGKNFSDALKKHPAYFSNFYIALVKSGEASGKLDMILLKLADHMERQREFRAKIRNALIYPSVIVSAMFIMIFVMFAFVMPQLLELYENFQVDLPASTRIVMAISDVASTYWYIFVIATVAAAFSLKKFLSTEKGKRILDEQTLRMPVLGNVVKTASLVDATRTLSILISSGVPILEGFAIVTDVNDNRVYKEAFARLTKQVEKGSSIGTAMANEHVFPPSLIQMTIVGEQTGHLDETLLKISEYYQNESESAIKGMLTLIEPSILVILGITVGLIVFAVLSPIFSLTNSIQ